MLMAFQGVDYIFNTSDDNATIDQLLKLINPLGQVGSIVPPQKPLDIAPLMYFYLFFES